MRKRGHYDRATIDAILDEGVLCHVGFVHEGAPVVIPTLYWREGDYVYLHGSAASRMLGTSIDKPICVTVTHLDGLVLARSAFHHSANYRSVVLFGKPKEVTDPREREARMRVFMEGLIPGPLGHAAAGQGEGTEGDAPPWPAHRRGLGEDPQRPAGR